MFAYLFFLLNAKVIFNELFCHINYVNKNVIKLLQLLTIKMTM